MSRAAMPSRRPGRAAAALLALALAACGPSPADDPHLQFAIRLAGAYGPFAQCVQDEIAKRQDFDGRLAERVVDRGLEDRLAAMSGRYLGKPEGAGDPARPVRVAWAGRMLQELGKYGATPEAPTAPGDGQVRRVMATVESMSLIASAMDVDCAPPQNLIQLMEQAENDYF